MKKILPILLVFMILLTVSCATKPEAKEAEPEVIEAVVVELDPYNVPVKVTTPEKTPETPVTPAAPEAPAASDVPAEKKAEESPAPVVEEVIETEEGTAIIVINDETKTEEVIIVPSAEIGEAVAEAVAETTDAVVEYPMRTMVSQTDMGEVILATRGTETSFTFPKSTSYDEIETIVLKMMDVFPQTSFVVNSQVSMIAPDNFVKDNWDTLDYILKYYLEKEEEPVEETVVELAEPLESPQVVEGEPAVEETVPVDVIAQKEEAPVQEKTAEPEKVQKKAVGILEKAASALGMSVSLFMLCVGGLILLILLVVLIIKIRRRRG